MHLTQCLFHGLFNNKLTHQRFHYCTNKKLVFDEILKTTHSTVSSKFYFKTGDKCPVKILSTRKTSFEFCSIVFKGIVMTLSEIVSTTVSVLVFSNQKTRTRL